MYQFFHSAHRSTAGAASPAGAPEAAVQRPADPTRVGTTNPSLQPLQAMRSQLCSDDQNMLQKIENYYRHIRTEMTNRDIVEEAGVETPSNPEPVLGRTMRRRASFLLNREAMNYVEDNQIRVLSYQRPDRTQVLLMNAIATSFKSQAEHVGDAALRDAQQGRRLCPMTLQPAAFNAFLAQNSWVARLAIANCTIGPAYRGRALKPVLERFAKSYFDKAAATSGAATLDVDSVEVCFETGGDSMSCTNQQDRHHVVLKIDDSGAEDFCSRQYTGAFENQSEAYFHHQLQGFEEHEPLQKLAALYLQLTLDEISTVEERHFLPDGGTGASAITRRQARATQEEYTYPGFKGFEDDMSKEPTQGMDSRSKLLGQLRQLPMIEDQFRRQFGQELFTDPRLRSWVRSVGLPYDLMSLTNPAARLSLQRAQMNAQALLQLQEFKR